MKHDIPFNDSDQIFEKVISPVESIKLKTHVNVTFSDLSDLDGDFDLYKTEKRLLFIRTGVSENKYFTYKEKSFSNTTREVNISDLKGIYMNLFDYSKLYNWLIGLIPIIIGLILILIIDKENFINDFFDIIGYILIIVGIAWIIYCFITKNMFSYSSVNLAFDSAFTDKREKISIYFYDGSILATDFYASMNFQITGKTRRI